MDYECRKTSAGIEKETFVVTPVPLTPVVTTVVSSQQIVPKTPIYDTVSVTGTGGAEIAERGNCTPMTADKTSATPCENRLDESTHCLMELSLLQVTDYIKLVNLHLLH